MLPARFPNLLVNGAQGIAVGMATNIPPHNLAEVCNAALKLIDKPDATLSELMRIVKGPDFPTGGLIMGDDGIKDAFRTGRGTIRVRAVTRSRRGKRGSQAIVLTEVPFQTSVDAIAGKLAELVESGKIDGVRDIRNESGQGKTRLVIELRRRREPADRAQQPVQAHRRAEHVPGQHGGARRRRAAHAQPAGVPAGTGSTTRWSSSPGARSTGSTRRRSGCTSSRVCVKALDMIDAIVKAIRAVEGPAGGARRARWRKPFEFSEIQANHILDMTLGRLTQLGREELDKEKKELETTVKELKRILAKRDVLMGVIREELVAIRDAHKAPRRAEIVTDDAGTIDVVALVEDEPYSVTVTARGYVRAVAERGRGGRGRQPGRARRDRAGDRHVGARRACCSSPIAAARTAPPCTSCRRNGSPPPRTSSSSATASG